MISNQFKNKRIIPSLEDLISPSNKRSTNSKTKIGFLIFENFSMASFTSCVDSLVTANLLSESNSFEINKIGINTLSVSSDIGISLETDTVVTNNFRDEIFKFDMVVVCGGLRCNLSENQLVTAYLSSLQKRKIYLVCLWNGVIPLASTGLINGTECSIHPNNHSYMKERFSSVIVSTKSFVINEYFASSAGVNSSQEMMLSLIEKIRGKELTKSIRQLLSCDKSPSDNESIQLNTFVNPRLPESLKFILKLMNNNIEEPLSIDELVSLGSLSRRQIERLFQKYLSMTPAKCYIELRLKHARNLLTQSNESITNIAVASGFANSSHFSNSFREHFGISPSIARQRSNF